VPGIEWKSAGVMYIPALSFPIGPTRRKKKRKMSSNPEGKSILDFFDPDCDAHMWAWEHYITNKVWPKGFLPEGVIFPENWEAKLICELAIRWMALKLYGKTNNQ